METLPTHTIALTLFKHFTAGTFAGLGTKDIIGFPDEQTAIKYLADIKSAIKAGKLEYRLTDYDLETI